MPQLARYMKQIMLKDFGLESQMKLRDAKVLVVGCGGLGCPVLSSFNAMGIGTLGFIDFDVVDETNLHRQFLYHHSDIGTPKVDVISTRLAAQNPATRLVPIREKLTVSNSLTLFNSYDIIVDATDNFESRYMINDACMLLQKPLVYGSVFAHQGQVAVFNTAHNFTIFGFKRIGFLKSARACLVYLRFIVQFQILLRYLLQKCFHLQVLFHLYLIQSLTER